MFVGFHFSCTLQLAWFRLRDDGWAETKNQKTAQVVPVLQDTPPQTTPPRPQESSLAGYDRNRGRELGWDLTNLFGPPEVPRGCHSVPDALIANCGSFYR